MTTTAATADVPSAKSRRVLVALLLAVQVIGAVYVVAIHAGPLWRDRWVQDDAYVSFRYAKNFVAGHGIVYNVGQYVEGYTNFLWTMFSAIPMAMGADDPLPFMHLLSMLLWLASYGLLMSLGVRLFRAGVWIAPLALVPLTYHYSFNLWFLSGMETPLVSFLTIAVLYAFSFDPKTHPSALLWASLAAVLLTMTRPDGVVTLAALAVAGVLLYWHPLLIEKRWRRYLLVPALPVLLIYLPFNAWRIAYYGSFYPNTYYTKVAYLTFYGRGARYLLTYLRAYPFLPYLGFAIVGAWLAPAGIVRRFLWGSLLMSAFVFFYVVRLGGDFMEWRFVTPVTGVLYPAIVIGASVVAHRLWTAFRGRRPADGANLGVANLGVANLGIDGWLVGLAVGAALTIATANCMETAKEARVPGQESIGLLRRYCDPTIMDWGTSGKVLQEVLPRDAVIATTSAGIIPFYCDRHCLDLHGLTDPEIAHSPVDPENRGRMGHEHSLDDFDKLRARGVDVFLFFAEPHHLARAHTSPSKTGEESVSVRLPDGRYTEIAILNTERVDVAALRKDPRLVFYGDVGISARHNLYTLDEKYRSYQIVDAVDIEDEASEREHAFEEPHAADQPYSHNYHEKILRYRPPLSDIILVDHGRRTPYQLRWSARNISASRDLVVVIRYDHTGSGIYELEVNGHKVDDVFNMPAGDDSWDEALLTVPAALLIEGHNDFRLIRTDQTDSNAELYYIWHLQPPADGAS
ncbi:MAG: hypothetical protein HYR72_08740 [Deltaproteobacteria bacterium]|nr:hypothetical protein [Deltaproteobacteria bacterium]MBI3388841.1 hypothetical protein [Deltaproteobacteria bacterium]